MNPPIVVGSSLKFLAIAYGPAKPIALENGLRKCLTRQLFAGLLYSVDDALTLRLGDSALASTLFPHDYHSFHGAARLPVKWMSMELFEDGVYTAQSDVVKSLTQLTAN